MFLLSFFVAKAEINTEGKDGWAKKLPIWRIKKLHALKMVFVEQKGKPALPVIIYKQTKLYLS